MLQVSNHGDLHRPDSKWSVTTSTTNAPHLSVFACLSKLHKRKLGAWDITQITFPKLSGGNLRKGGAFISGSVGGGDLKDSQSCR